MTTPLPHGEDHAPKKTADKPRSGAAWAWIFILFPLPWILLVWWLSQSTDDTDSLGSEQQQTEGDE